MSINIPGVERCRASRLRESSARSERERLEWVQKARVRFREDGDVLTGEALIVPKYENDLLNRLRKAYEVANGADWRLHDVNIVPVHSLE